ncbi:hypothetical protein [Algihabitans sp.]|uniref:hypothetical protein n=1 Tax=Algihabitans sp. TaxID=2821514 RepID=UPI003BAAD321
MLADKATAQAEIARNLGSGAATPASLPPDLAAVLNGEEQAELEDWWRDGLRVSPDAALFESLHALFPAFPEEVSLESPRIARHLSPEQQALVRRRREETGTPGAPGAATGEGAAAGDRVRLAGLDETLEEAGFDARAEGLNGPWGVKRRRVVTLPDDPDPRETQLAVGLFGDDGGEGEEPEEPGEEAVDAVEPKAFTVNEDEASELDRIMRELAERSDLSEEEIESYGRDILKLVPGLGEVLSAQDAYQAFRAAEEALNDRNFYAALEAAALGLVELAGAAPIVGRLARLGKIGLRAAWRIARNVRYRRTAQSIRQRDTNLGKDISDEDVARSIDERALKGTRSRRELPSGFSGFVEKPNGVTAWFEYSKQSIKLIRRLNRAIEDVSPPNAKAVSSLIDGAVVSTKDSSHNHIVNIERDGGRSAAEAAFYRALEEADADLTDVRPHKKGGVFWRSPDGTQYRLYHSNDNGDTVLMIVPSARAPASKRGRFWEIKIRFLNEQTGRPR